MAATRFYLPPTGAAAVTPAYTAEWNNTTDAVRRAMSTTVGDIGDADIAVSESVVDGDDVLAVQFVSGTLPGAGTLTGTVKGQIYALQAASNRNCRAQILVKLMSGDGTTLRGVAFAGTLNTGEGTTPASEFSTTKTNRAFPRGGAQSLTSTDYSAGDRVVVECGARCFSMAGQFTLTFATQTADTDLPEDETTTGTSHRTWVEFSHDFFSATTARGAQTIWIG